MILIGGLRNITKEKPNQQGFIPLGEYYFKESFNTRSEARNREKYLKKWNWKRIYQKWSSSSVGYLPAGRQGAAAFKR